MHNKPIAGIRAVAEAVSRQAPWRVIAFAFLVKPMGAPTGDSQQPLKPWSWSPPTPRHLKLSRAAPFGPWLVNTYIPMDGKIRQILNVVVVVAIVVGYSTVLV